MSWFSFKDGVVICSIEVYEWVCIHLIRKPTFRYREELKAMMDIFVKLGLG